MKFLKRIYAIHLTRHQIAFVRAALVCSRNSVISEARRERAAVLTGGSCGCKPRRTERLAAAAAAAAAAAVNSGTIKRIQPPAAAAANPSCGHAIAPSNKVRHFFCAAATALLLHVIQA